MTDKPTPTDADMTTDDPPRLRVNIAVAVSEAGTVRLAVADSNWIQEERKHQQMLTEIRADKQLWSLRYLTTAVPYPISREDQP